MNERGRSTADIPQGFLDELLAHTVMPELVGRHVALEEAANGRVWKAACPFHEDDGTSFYVHGDGCHCFGCGAHEDAIGFAMRISSLQIEEAVAMLAAAAGLTAPAGCPGVSEAGDPTIEPTQRRSDAGNDKLRP